MLFCLSMLFICLGVVFICELLMYGWVQFIVVRLSVVLLWLVRQMVVLVGDIVVMMFGCMFEILLQFVSSLLRLVVLVLLARLVWVLGLCQLWWWLQVIRLLCRVFMVVVCWLFCIVVFIMQFLVSVLLFRWLSIWWWIILVRQGVLILIGCLCVKVLLGFLMVCLYFILLMQWCFSICFSIQLCCVSMCVGLLMGLIVEGSWKVEVMVVYLVIVSWLSVLLQQYLVVVVMLQEW